MAVRGYATIDLRPVNRTPFVRLDAALESAISTYATVSQPNWKAVANHLINLKVLSIETLSIRTRDQRILLVLNRRALGGGLDIEEATNYHAALGQWCNTLSDYLPRLELTEKEAANVKRLQDWVGRWTDSSSIGAAAGKLLAVLYLSKGKGVCVTVHPVGSAPAGFVKQWTETDLTNEYFLNPRINNSNYLWNATNNDHWYGGASGVENPDDFNFEPRIPDMRSLLRSVSDD